MDYPLIVWVGPPVTPAGLFHYASRKTAALHVRDAFGRRIESANRILDRLSAAYPALRDEMAQLERQIVLTHPKVGRVMLDGREWADTSCSLDIEVEMNARQRDAARDLCRRIFKTLAQIHHPDKGGDAEMFQRLQQSVLSLDIEFLRVQQALAIDEKSLAWRCSEGAQFWDLQNQKVHVNSRKLEANLQFRAVAAYLAGQKAIASNMMRKWMEQRLNVLRHELAHILNPRLSEPTDEM